MLSALVVEALAVEISVEVLADVNINISTVIMTVFEFTMSMTCDCWGLIAFFHCARVVQARTPSNHV